MSKLFSITTAIALAFLFVNPQAQAQASLAGRWQGFYFCSQGWTGLYLDVTYLFGENYSAIFRFFPIPENPGVPKGVFTMTGQIRRRDGLVNFNAQRWLRQPDGWATVDLVGFVDTNTMQMSGSVRGGPTCTTFSLVKAR
jgi:hypothetical protein